MILFNGTILLYTMVLSPIELLEHVRQMDVGSMECRRWSSLWNSQQAGL